MKMSKLPRWPKKRVVAILVALVASIGSASVWFVKSVWIPRLEVAQPVGQTSSVKRGEKVEHQFLLRNAGRRSLTVERIDSDCSCTASMVDQSTIEPGATAYLKAIVDTTSFMDGRFSRGMSVVTNDPTRSEVLLQVQGSVTSEILFAQSYVDFGVLEAGKLSGKEKEIGIEIVAEDAIEILDVKSTSASVAVSLRRVDDRNFVLLASPRPARRPDWISGAVIVRTSSSALPEVKLPIQGFIR